MSSISQQKIISLHITKLKHIEDVTISFEDKALTAILGPNGHGKSTIIHALACCYEPIDRNLTKNYPFSYFFIPNTDAKWQGSELTLCHSYRDQKQQITKSTEYTKNSDRWKPIYSRRPKRHVYYIGIDKFIPIIESEKQKTKVEYKTETIDDKLTQNLLEKANYIFNKTYTAYNKHTSRKGKTYIGVESNGNRYSSLSMSAGEQKIFLLLETIFNADEYSLILIDEIDLLLHDYALKRLLEVINERANHKKLQIVFTTHRESVIEFSNLINIRHIFYTVKKTLCFNNTKPDAINRLTGKQERNIEIFVEDDLAYTIIKKILGQLKIQKYADVKKFGCASNCFTTIAGLLLSGEKCHNKLFVLDGDVYIKFEDKQKGIKKVLTGHGMNIERLRDQALQQIKQFILPPNTKPEKYLHQLIRETSKSDNGEFDEIIEVAKSIHSVNDSHKYISDIIESLNYEKSVGYAKIIDILSTHENWKQYISEIYNWLHPKVSDLRE